jgi:hypothetical protein
MSIDRIGKGPSPAGVSPTSSSPSSSDSVGRAAETGATFDISGQTGAGARPAEATSAASEATGASPANEVRSGHLSIDQYLEQRVTEATRHLEGKVPAADLGDIQTMLRSQLRNDPALIEMVRAATGVTPPADDE